MSHPRHRKSILWRIGQASPLSLFAGGLAILLSLAVAMAALYLLAEEPDPQAPHGHREPRILWLALDGLRSLLGADAFPRQGDNPVHQVLATFASVVGSLFPALLIGIAAVRLFSIKVFVWRTHVSACLAAELDGERRGSTVDSRHAFLAVRWYKRLDNLSLVNQRAEAFLRLKSVSVHDGSTLYRYHMLKVLTLDGTEGNECVWPETFSGMPFTLWIPLHAALADGRVVQIQGSRLDDKLDDTDDRQLVVRVSGTVTLGPTTRISEEHRYHLRHDVQIGRFVPVDPDLSTPARSWPGWRGFDERVTHHLFIYDPRELATLTQRRATLRDWEIHWRTGEPMLMERKGARTQGVLVEITAEQLAELDLRDGIYVRRSVTEHIEPWDGKPGVVWTKVSPPIPPIPPINEG